MTKCKLYEIACKKHIFGKIIFLNRFCRLSVVSRFSSGNDALNVSNDPAIKLFGQNSSGWDLNMSNDRGCKACDDGTSPRDKDPAADIQQVGTRTSRARLKGRTW